ncbi:MAG: hypothetical protein ACREPM_05450 [Gemmatimonadaceae bacterium]
MFSLLARAHGTTYLHSSSPAPNARIMHIPGFIKNHKLVTVIVIIVLTPIIVVTLWTTIALHYTYSTGERAGFLQKISKRGWLCKTWEGDVQLTALPGAAPEIFTFSVRSDSIAERLNTLAGQHVVVHYQQHKGLPSSCFGDTEYFIDSVRLVGSP